MSLDNEVESLIEQLKSFVNKPNAANKPNINSITSSNKSNVYQSPIKGGWNSSGGFDANSIRPNGKRGHMGVDMRAPAGTSIYPLTSGVVTNVGTDPVGGNVVSVQHPNGVKTYYAHLSTVSVQKNQEVDNDTVLGAVGDSGNAKGTFPHLHFQVWENNNLKDPANYFNVPKYTDLSADEKANGLWLSNKSKQEALSFNMKKHIEQGKLSTANKIEQLHKIAIIFKNIALS